MKYDGKRKKLCGGRRVFRTTFLVLVASDCGCVGGRNCMPNFSRSSSVFFVQRVSSCGSQMLPHTHEIRGNVGISNSVHSSARLFDLRAAVPSIPEPRSSFKKL